jgi:hypothetical protein
MGSPYESRPETDWPEVTRRLIEQHPLSSHLVEIVLDTWQSIFASKIGRHGFHIGPDICPRPQIMGFLLHELIALETAARFPKQWRGEREKDEKDLVYIPDPFFSIEIKTSSHEKHVFGNRSYAQEGEPGKKAKLKSGYYLTVNFGKFMSDGTLPAINRIGFGWIDHTDWLGQISATGQQSRLQPSVYKYKLVVLHQLKSTT